MYVSEHRRRINLEPDQLRESLAKLQEEQTRNLHSLYEFRDTIYLKDASFSPRKSSYTPKQKSY